MANGYALLVGVKQVDPNTHNNDDKTEGTEAAEVDVDIIYDILSAKGFHCTCLKTQLATRESILKHLSQIASTVTEDDFTIFFYSGHGGQLPDYMSSRYDETDGEDETLVAYDYDILDDELWDVWCKFPRGSRILMISDSCNSGTNARSSSVLGTPAEEKIKLFSHVGADTLQAQLIHMGGAKDGTEAAGYELGGAFTLAINHVLNTQPLTGGYPELIDETRKLVRAIQVPELWTFGQVSDKFLYAAPFTI